MVSTYPPLPPRLPSNPLLLLTPATQTTQILAFRAKPASKELGVFLLGGGRGEWELFHDSV